MKSVYIALIEGQVTAFHHKKSVIEDYLRAYKDSNPTDEGYIAKAKKESVKDTKSYQELYLVEVYENIYIQNKYQDAYMSLIVSDDVHIFESMKSEVMNALSADNLSKKQRKNMINSLKTLNEIERGGNIYYVPTIKQLECANNDLERYRNEIY